MRLTTKGRFAVTAMIDLALRGTTGPVTLSAIGKRQQISLSYLEQMFGKLRRHQLVEATRGPGGGYSLGRKASEITVADIIFAIEDVQVDADGVETHEGTDGATGGRSVTDELWASLNRRTVEFLDGVALQSLVDEQIAKGVNPEAEPVAAKPSMLQRPPPKSMRVRAPNSVFALGTFLTAKR